MNSINDRPVAISGSRDLAEPTVSFPRSGYPIRSREPEYTRHFYSINAFAYRHVNIRRYFIGLLPVRRDPANLMSGISPVTVIAYKTVCLPDD